MYIHDLDEFITFILRVVEEAIICSSMHQNYFSIDIDGIHSAIRVALEKDNKYVFSVQQEKKNRLH